MRLRSTLAKMRITSEALWYHPCRYTQIARQNFTNTINLYSSQGLRNSTFASHKPMKAPIGSHRPEVVRSSTRTCGLWTSVVVQHGMKQLHANALDSAILVSPPSRHLYQVESASLFAFCTSWSVLYHVSTSDGVNCSLMCDHASFGSRCDVYPATILSYLFGTSLQRDLVFDRRLPR
jgi:hypothetical protein